MFFKMGFLFRETLEQPDQIKIDPFDMLEAPGDKDGTFKNSLGVCVRWSNRTVGRVLPCMHQTWFDSQQHIWSPKHCWDNS